MTGRVRTILTTLVGCVGFLFALTIPFWIWPLDLEVQSRFFDPEGRWASGEAPFWQFLYHFGTLPAIIVVLAALLVFVLSFRVEKFVPWRKAAAYLVLCMAVGPGLLINVGFKDHWGRPRPRDVEVFGGSYAHERVWIADGSSPGKSFPCGHCSMGFYFLGLALLFRRWRTALAISGFAVVFGGLIGMARIAQGGHFLSDVIWSGGFCLLASLGLFYALGLDRSVRFVPKSGAQLKLPPSVAIGAGSIGVCALLFVALGTPYHRDEMFSPKNLGREEKLELSLVLEGDEHKISVVENGTVRIRSIGNGFGLPGSAIKIVTKEEKSEDELYFQLKQRLSGWFTELRQVNELQVPSDFSGNVKIVIRSGVLSGDLREIKGDQDWRVFINNPKNLQVVPSGAETFQLQVMPLEN
tara:strand:+ start:4051 stop:5283 length:1233 start_codon:yes stop_codon:yes gene_type:complete